MEDLKTMAQVYLPAEEQLINQLFKIIQDIIKERKKIPYLDSGKIPKEEYLEYFIVTDALITFKRQGSKAKKCEVTGSQLKNAIKFVLRTDGEVSKQSFNKLFGPTVGTALFSFIDLMIDEITKHKIAGFALSHKSFGAGIISRIELDKEFIWFEYAEEIKKLSMDYFILSNEDAQRIKKILVLE